MQQEQQEEQRKQRKRISARIHKKCRRWSYDSDDATDATDATEDPAAPGLDASEPIVGCEGAVWQHLNAEARRGLAKTPVELRDYPGIHRLPGTRYYIVSGTLVFRWSTALRLYTEQGGQEALEEARRTAKERGMLGGTTTHWRPDEVNRLLCALGVTRTNLNRRTRHPPDFSLVARAVGTRSARQCRTKWGLLNPLQRSYNDAMRLARCRRSALKKSSSGANPVPPVPPDEEELAALGLDPLQCVSQWVGETPEAAPELLERIPEPPCAPPPVTIRTVSRVDFAPMERSFIYRHTTPEQRLRTPRASFAFPPPKASKSLTERYAVRKRTDQSKSDATPTTKEKEESVLVAVASALPVSQGSACEA